jgi:hypothetical protein
MRELTHLNSTDTRVTIQNESQYKGKMKVICNGKRVCGSSIGILILTYFLIIIPTILFFIFM